MRLWPYYVALGIAIACGIILIVGVIVDPHFHCVSAGRVPICWHDG